MAGKREEQMKEITERLEQGVKDLFTSDMYTQYLRTMSRFHNYSFNNTLLIAMQKPDATLVAGFQAWQKKFERHVKRGEKGIQIIAPAPIREKQEMEKIDPETQEPVLRPDGQPETEEVEIVIPRFRVTTVFDVSQTEGKPLPEIDTPELMGSVENYDIFMGSIEAVSLVPIRFDTMDSDTKGYYHQVDKEIVIQEGMSESQTMKTAVHEVTHALLHDRELMKESGEWKSQMTREVEAESVAYTVCQYFGLDTSDYSFPYIAGWSSHMDMKELRSSMDTIRKTAGEFIDIMTETMQSLAMDLAPEEQLDEQVKGADMELVQEAQAHPGRRDEELLLSGSENRYGIYQIDEDGKGREYRFMNMDFVSGHGLAVDRTDYKLIYSDVLTEAETLDSLYEKFNFNHPADFTGHSLSVSDVVVLQRDGNVDAYYVDSFGFTELPEFVRQNEVGQTMRATKENADFELDAEHPNTEEPIIRKALEGPEIPVYKFSGAFASRHMEAHWYRMSMRANIACKEAIETAIADNFDGLHLKHDVVNSVLEAFGEERLSYVLANTIQCLDDERFSKENKDWARTIPVVADEDGFGGDRRNEFIVSSHPAVLDGFIGLARKEMGELIAQKEAKQLKVDAGRFIDGYYVVMDLQKKGVLDIYKYVDMEEALQKYFSLPNDKIKAFGIENSKPMNEMVDFIQCKNGIDTIIEDFRKVKDWDNPEITDAVKAIELALDNHDTEIAYQAGDKYIAIQIVSDGYDYTFYDQNFKGLDGGVYDDPDIPIQKVVEDILTDEGIALADCKVINYDELQEKVEEMQQETSKEPHTLDQAEPAADMVEAKISFYVAECMEFPVLGEFHEDLSLDEAMKLYHKIPAERMNGIKGVGFCLEDGSDYDGKFDLMSGGRILKDVINDIPHYRDSPLVQKAITDIEMLLSEQEKTSRKTAETNREIPGGTSKKQSVLNALRERQTKLKAQDQSGQKEKEQMKRKGEQEL